MLAFMIHRYRLAPALTMVVILVSCGDGGAAPPDGATPSVTATRSTPSATASPPSTPSPPEADLQAARIRLVEIATLDQPLAMAVREGDDGLYVAGQGGAITAIRGGETESILDLSDEVSSGGEQGLLGLEFSPDGAFVYVNYTDPEGDTRVVEFAMADGRVDEGSRREVLFVDQPYANHNGGNLVFGADGYLYIGLGDGGSGGDPHDNGQSLGTMLGKMVRIDPRPEGEQPYGVPRDNPFIGQEGARPEIWAYGLRNPWRYSFDRESEDLWIGDVGQDQVEEIDFQLAGSSGGENYGWNRLEGSVPFAGEAPTDAIPPIHEYTEGCAVTGGYVYRGQAIPDLQGAYLFADFCGGQIMAIRQEEGRVVEERAFDVTVGSLSSFGEDLDGELYALSLGGPVYRIDQG